MTCVYLKCCMPCLLHPQNDTERSLHFNLFQWSQFYEHSILHKIVHAAAIQNVQINKKNRIQQYSRSSSDGGEIHPARSLVPITKDDDLPGGWGLLQLDLSPGQQVQENITSSLTSSNLSSSSWLSCFLPPGALCGTFIASFTSPHPLCMISSKMWLEVVHLSLMFLLLMSGFSISCFL